MPHSRQQNPPVDIIKRLFFLLIATFLVLAPASVSGFTESDSGSVLKWARVCLLVICFLVGLQWFRIPRWKDLSAKVLLMSVVFCAAAGWSTLPLWGLLFKGMFVCSVCASFALANCLRTEAEFRTMIRTLTFACIVALSLVAYLVFVERNFMLWKGRLIVGGMNANSMGLSAAIFGLLNAFHLLLRDKVVWRVCAVISLVLMMVLIVYSGSRAAVLTLVVGGALLLPAMAKRRTGAIALGIVSLSAVVLVSVFWFGLSDDPASFGGPFEEEGPAMELRIFRELTKDTRMRIWRSEVSIFSKNPVLGAGWRHRGRRWILVQSAYLQVIVEAGILGIIAVLLFGTASVRMILRAMRTARRTRGFESMMLHVFAATFFAIAFHGIFESAAVVGSSPNAILLGFSAAQLDLNLRRQRSQTRKRRTVVERPAMPARHPAVVSS